MLTPTDDAVIRTYNKLVSLIIVVNELIDSCELMTLEDQELVPAEDLDQIKSLVNFWKVSIMKRVNEITER
jgi:hypothetical protein